MTIHRLYILLVAWGTALLAPGILMALGVFGSIGAMADMNGAMAGAWVLGYLVQFALFLWIMNIVAEQKMLWWFVASLLPWATDWTVPVSPAFLLLWLAVTFAVAYWIASADARADTLKRQGVRATGVVLEVLKPFMGMNVVINNVYIRRNVRFRIEREDGAAPYEAILKGTFMLGEIPSVGDKIPLVVDPNNPQHFEYDNDTIGTAAPDRIGGQPASRRSERPRTESPSPAGRSNIADDLERLVRLRDRGALSDFDFEAAKKKLLSS